MSCDFREVLGKISFKDKRDCFVYLDPPYLEGAAKVAIEQIFSLGLLAEQGRVYLEHAEKLPPTIETPMAKLKQTKRYGSCAVSIYERADDEAKPE